jgi:hypothetical protein
MKEKLKKHLKLLSNAAFQMRYKIWDKRPWKGRYITVAEKTVMPHINDGEAWFWFGWCVFLVSLLVELAFCSLNTATQRAGAVLVACGILMEFKVSHLRVSIDTIKNGTISPKGWLHSAHLPGQFVQEWVSEKVNDVPVSIWLMARENNAYKIEARAFWAVIFGTVIWAYGDLFV